MEYEIPLQKSVYGKDLIPALEQVAAELQWQYSSEPVVQRLILSPDGRPPFTVYPKTFQVTITDHELPQNVAGDVRGEMTILVNPSHSYSALTLRYAGIENEGGKPQDMIPQQRTLDTFVLSLRNELRTLR